MKIMTKTDNKFKIGDIVSGKTMFGVFTKGKVLSNVNEHGLLQISFIENDRELTGMVKPEWLKKGAKRTVSDNEKKMKLLGTKKVRGRIGFSRGQERVEVIPSGDSFDGMHSSKNKILINGIDEAVKFAVKNKLIGSYISPFGSIDFKDGKVTDNRVEPKINFVNSPIFRK